ncbi:MAG: glycosyltransferase family protein [Candidatus Nitrosotenuis sp.]
MKILSIIQARTESTRLPKKVLLKLESKSILEHIVDFLRFSKLTTNIVIATTTLSQDDEIKKISQEIGVECFRGNSNDVLDRFFQCMTASQGDLVVRLTADDPLVDPTLVDKVIHTLQTTGCDYVSNMLHRTFPYGYSSGEGISFKILKQLHETLTDPLDREHVTRHIIQNPNLYDVRDVLAPPELARPDWRLTVDYKEDFDLMKEIFSKLYKPNSFIKYESLVELLDKNPQLLKINEMHH